MNNLPSGLRLRPSFAGRRSGLADPEQALNLSPVKTDYYLAIDDRDRGRPDPQILKFLQRLLVFPNILSDECHALTRKKLFLLVAGSSAGLGIDDYLFRHVIPLV